MTCSSSTQSVLIHVCLGSWPALIVVVLTQVHGCNTLSGCRTAETSVATWPRSVPGKSKGVQHSAEQHSSRGSHLLMGLSVHMWPDRRPRGSLSNSSLLRFAHSLCVCVHVFACVYVYMR